MHKPLAAASLLLVTLCAAAAHAHAFLDHASPLVGGTVAAAPENCGSCNSEKLNRRK